jgi:hypothetical protein
VDSGIRWRCWICNFVYRGPGALRNHIVAKHGLGAWKGRPDGWIRVCQVKVDSPVPRY